MLKVGDICTYRNLDIRVLKQDPATFRVRGAIWLEIIESILIFTVDKPYKKPKVEVKNAHLGLSLDWEKFSKDEIILRISRSYAGNEKSSGHYFYRHPDILPETLPDYFWERMDFIALEAVLKYG